MNDLLKHRDAVDQLREASLYFRSGCSNTLIENIKNLVEENKTLKQKIKDTDEMVMAKRHYYPLMIKILEVAESRGDVETINRVHCFILEGKVI